MECVLDHIVLNVEDEEAILRFYSQVLLLTPERVEEYRAGTAPFPSVRLNADTIIDLFPKHLWQSQARTGQGRENMNHFCLTMDHETWTHLLERLQAHKIAIEDGPVSRWGAHGSGISVYFRDPENNLLEARYYERHTDSEPCLLES
jgi:catechol 2,3-dioxygenase-like lactoylglutathione lyase family enzyme